MPTINGTTIDLNKDNEHYEALVKRLTKMTITMILPGIMLLFR